MNLFFDAFTLTAVAAAMRIRSRRKASRSLQSANSLVPSSAQRPVAVFDAGWPPGIAFIRSLGRAGVPLIVYGNERRPTGRFSRYVTEFRPAPSVQRTDHFVDWLSGEIAEGRIDLIAPTSDYMAFNVAAAQAQLSDSVPPGTPEREHLFDCLFKDRFATAIAAAGFPTPATFAPTTADEAVKCATSLGYPVLLKPRSHVGVGITRGTVVHSDRELRRAFIPFEIGPGHDTAFAVDGDLALPLVQRYFKPGTVDVVSVSGMLDDDGNALAVSHSRKTHQWPPRLGIGTQFQALPAQAFTGAAVDAVRQVLGRGVFELEVLVHRSTGEYWAIDLNPRGFGQMALDIACGSDLPKLWYDAVVGATVIAPPPFHTNGHDAATWRMGLHYYAGAVVRAVAGDGRHGAVDSARQRSSRPPSAHGRRRRVGAVWDWRDPVPSLVWTMKLLRHPGGLVRPYLRDLEAPGAPHTPDVALAGGADRKP
jgi:predicted ATP-grasp superfamily ATP-dependent carboligase